jgi:hypothetical protein
MQPADLYETCDRCGGLGFYYQRKANSEGQGGPAAVNRPCPECDRGLKLTPTGKVLVDFFKTLLGRGII